MGGGQMLKGNDVHTKSDRDEERYKHTCTATGRAGARSAYLLKYLLLLRNRSSSFILHSVRVMCMVKGRQVKCQLVAKRRDRTKGWGACTRAVRGISHSSSNKIAARAPVTTRCTPCAAERVIVLWSDERAHLFLVVKALFVVGSLRLARCRPVVLRAHEEKSGMRVMSLARDNAEGEWDREVARGWQHMLCADQERCTEHARQQVRMWFPLVTHSGRPESWLGNKGHTHHMNDRYYETSGGQMVF
jgi:hypothetical protein